MKSNRNFTRYFWLPSFAAVALLLVSWSPPGNDKAVFLGTGNTQTQGNNKSFWGVVSGMNNNLWRVDDNSYGCVVGIGHKALVKSSVISGTYHGESSGAAPTITSSVLTGYDNDGTMTSSMVSGSNNDGTMSYSMVSGINNDGVATTTTMVSGQNNMSNVTTSMIAGSSNTSTGGQLLVSGDSNTVEGPTVGSSTNHSAAIGQLNHVHSTYGWAIGYQNDVGGQRHYKVPDK